MKICVRTEEADLDEENSQKKRESLRFLRNFSGFLRGNKQGFLEENVEKTQNRRILDIFAKNGAVSTKNSGKTQVFESFFAVSQQKHGFSMLRSPLNKYSFLRIDEKSRRIEEKGLKTSDFREKTDKSAQISQLHRRIQSAVPHFLRESEKKPQKTLKNSEFSENVAKKPRKHSAIYKTKHNMFFFIKKP